MIEQARLKGGWWMIRKPQYTFGCETSKSDLINMRAHLKGMYTVSKTVKSTVTLLKALYPAKRVTRECVNWGWRHRRLIRASGMFRRS